MGFEPEVAQAGPYEWEVEEGDLVFWCRCGRSATQPICDGSHAGTGISPMGWRAPGTGTVFLCGCKRTANPPLCDGHHNDL
ncbi:CDGSH iron-sulfur domain-containing protein [Skermanella rosea]|jgi:CDGSH iron-sulfur domain-containing protein 3|uniref:CDGSH iron-sulfur domain-containing protein n=1 Tax=Skermanella cutis TaxID=2775420 RepID=A0ABX7BEE8_9PROT|nr:MULTISPECIES: CDGSH iron-sulfur domain-containing protein [Skermanella]QQP90812.1 CDGSH iron-sulfur domain-containing protein [Skermanella sp. TT6]UEM02293.1 CDGSH iron-sulfur domain-containing protein [Skermanella rosea]